MSKNDETELKEKKEKKGEVEIEYVIQKDRTQKIKGVDLKALKNKLRKRETEIKLLKREHESLKEEYLRKIAETENLRKRAERDKSEYYKYALSEFLKELLLILDNFERALESQDQGDGKSFRDGIELIYKQYLDLILKQGVKPIEVKEKKFDPQFQQAFASEESEDVEEPEVSEEFQRGYTLHDRLLRPALVKVVVPKKGD